MNHKERTALVNQMGAHVATWLQAMNEGDVIKASTQMVALVAGVGLMAQETMDTAHPEDHL